MKYVFGFDLDYKKYKKDFRSIVSIDDMMIDDFVLTESQRIAKFYTLDIANCKKFVIDNICEDSNYVNGFITRSAEYTFLNFLLIPLDLFNHDLELRIQELESKFSKDMNETTFNELKELKNERKIN